MRRAGLIMLPLLLGAMPATALELPPRAPGLWELNVTSNIGPNNSRTEVVKHCVDSDTDALLRRLEMMMLQQAKCQYMDLRREGDAFRLDAECKAGETDIAASAMTRGDFSTQYTGTLTIRRLSTPAFPTIPPEMTIVTEGKRIGLCTTDLRPGDMVLPNGLTTSVYDLPGMPPAPPAPPVADFVLPARAPGLWEVTTTVEGNPEQPPVAHWCLDAEIEREVNRIRVDRTCSAPRVEQVDGNTTVQWNCRPAAEKTRLRVVIAGDFESTYSIAITRSRDSGLPQFTLDLQQKIEGRRIGACRAGQAPGDTIYPDGRMVPYRKPN